MQITKGKTPKAWLVTIYGVPGVGKSTLATFAPEPVFINVEDGLDRVECDKTPKIVTYGGLRDALRWAYNCEYKTIVIDTLSAVEALLVQQILDSVNAGREPEYHCKTIDDKVEFGYGSGVSALRSQWGDVMGMLYNLKDAGKNVLCIGHEAISSVSNPAGENYDKFTLDVQKKCVGDIVSRMDAVLFAHYEKAFAAKANSKQQFAVETGRRLLQTDDKPYCVAKNRFELPGQMVLNDVDQRKQLFEALK